MITRYDLKYPYSKIVTISDLETIHYGLTLQYRALKWWEFRRKYALKVARQVAYELLFWLRNDKPALKTMGDIYEDYN